MPSIDQCEGASGAGALTALPSTLEIFDKFKPVSENGKHSDSEESFHLLLDDDDTEHQSSGGDKEVHNEETEDEILNKFETVPNATSDIEPHVEESILDDEEDQSKTKSDTNVITSPEKEFKSLYEDEVEPIPTSEPMEVNEDTSQVNGDSVEDPLEMEEDDNNVASLIDTLEQEEEEEKPVENGVPMELDSCDIKITEAQSAEEPRDSVDTAEEPVKETNEIIDEAESKDMPEAVVEPTDNPESVTDGASEETNVEEPQEEIKKDDAILESDKQDEQVSEVNIEEIKEAESDKPEEPVSEVNGEGETEEIKVSDDDKSVSEAKIEETAEENNAKSLEELLPSNEDSVFKVPEELPKEDQETNKEEPEVTSDKSNDKTEDESDLLDVTMVRETEEDDACAMADIMTDIQTKTSEISDEERMDTEQETSDKEGEDFDDDNAMGFDETDEESHTTGEDDSSSCSHTKRTAEDDSSSCSHSKTNAEDDSSSCSHTKRKNKIVEISDSSNNATSSVGEEPPVVEKVKVDEPTVVADATVTEVADDKEKCEEKKDESDKIVLAEPEKTDKLSDKPEENSEANKEVPEEVTAIVENLIEEETDKNIPENYRISVNKRAHVLSESEKDITLSPKKAKIEPEAAAQPITDQALPEKLKVLTDFAKFMQCRKLTSQLTRSDLEQFCIQKICECLMLKSSEGDLHQQIKKNEKTLEALRRDIAQLSKQCKDLDIVNKKLMCEIRNPNAAKRPLVPLKITRSVGLQVRLNPGSDPGQYRNKRPSVSGSAITTPQKQQVSSPAVNRKLNVTTPTPTQTSSVGVGAQTSSAVRQVLQNSPQKSSPLTSAPTTTSSTNTLLSQALQTRPKPASPAIAPKRTPAPATTPAKKSSGVIVDLTDEDGQQSKSDKISNTIKLVSRGGGSTPNNKTAPAKGPSPAVKTNIIQGKQVGVAKTVPANKQNTTLPQGIRLAQAIQTSSANGSPQMVYVVPTITNAGGQQKVAFVNFQPTIPGQTVSVLSNTNSRPTTGLALKSVAGGGSGGGGTVTTRPQKHPAPLPVVRVALDPKLKPLLPKPHLTIKRIDTGIILQWKMPYNLDQYESIASYQLYAYQETSAPPNTEMWRKVGDVKALALPMACTLTQFADKNKYYFAVRSVDVHKRIGAFSDPEEISL